MSYEALRQLREVIPFRVKQETRHQEPVGNLRVILESAEVAAKEVEALNAEIEALKAEAKLTDEMNAQLREQNTAIDAACARLEREIEALKAAAAGEPDGWVMVPVEPTPEMQRAGVLAYFGGCHDKNDFDDAYRAMLAAAPKPPEAQHLATSDPEGHRQAIADHAAEAAGAGDARDAERYRHMRASAAFQDRNGPGACWHLPRWDRNLPIGERLDAAVDAAIAAQRGEKG